ncbi:srp19 protein [Cystoisospora suis]|uniref:Srp19 protein n=1 Tax=Cystoisospora suis TaxID=483139 RepID=A0A2C6LBR1_9APIC|nr:srp19 protein [Cystoisospora suis]
MTRHRNQGQRGGGGGMPPGFPMGMPPGGLSPNMMADALSAMGAGGGPPGGLPEGVNPELFAQMFGCGGAEGGGPPGGPIPTQRGGLMPNDGVDRSKWQIIYPAYINKKRTTAGGRRVPLEIAVDDPKVDEMIKICEHLAIPAAIEYLKRYPRDWLLSHGRLRVQLKDDNRKPTNPEIPDKKALMKKMCELIPQLKSRCAPPAAPAASSTKKKKKK